MYLVLATVDGRKFEFHGEDAERMEIEVEGAVLMGRNITLKNHDNEIHIFYKHIAWVEITHEIEKTAL